MNIVIYCVIGYLPTGEIVGTEYELEDGIEIFPYRSYYKNISKIDDKSIFDYPKDDPLR